MKSDDARSSIYEYLLTAIPGAKSVSNGKQIVCRCPKCMDSSNISSAHFFIGPFSGTPDFIQYDCKLCQAHGLFTFSTLRLFGVYQYELGVLLNQYNGSIGESSSYGNMIYTPGMIHRVQNTVISTTEESAIKLKYINQRLGTDMTYQDIIANKIILNLYDFLNENRIYHYTRSTIIMNELNRYFIGFLSYDNGFINMRRLCSEGKVTPSIDNRYINYNVYNNIDNSFRFYIPPTNVDIMALEPTDIWITEGPFDTLGVKYNVSENPNKDIFLSVAGKSYLAGIKFIMENIGLINIRINLCPDGDVSDYKMFRIAEYLSPFNIPISIHRNSSPGQKDFGVNKTQTSDSVRVLWE